MYVYVYVYVCMCVWSVIALALPRGICHAHRFVVMHLLLCVFVIIIYTSLSVWVISICWLALGNEYIIYMLINIYADY